jgi:pyruvate,water dikinase
VLAENAHPLEAMTMGETSLEEAWPPVWNTDGLVKSDYRGMMEQFEHLPIVLQGTPRIASAGDMERTTDNTSPETLLVAPLRRFSAADLAQAGGKGANLGALLRAGYPVPPGFVITTAAYDRFVADNRLQETIGNPPGREQDDGTVIRAAFEDSSIPPDVGQSLLAAYEQLGEGPVAVRSSATAEDLPEAAFAGQQDTYLNVIGPDALLSAVRRCWASLWTERAIRYRARLGIEPHLVKLAVVVQRLVDAEWAGVLFTANPVSGARDQIVIDASPGLGEVVVSGLVTPDHYVMERRWWGWHVVERRIGRREAIVRPQAGGGTEQVPGPARAETPVLPDRALRRLARLGMAIEGHFGQPQDIEWAWAGGEPSILQSRPITALPLPAPRPSKPIQLLAGILAEIMPARPYPLEYTTWGPEMLLSAILTPIFGLVGIAAPPVDKLFIEEDGVVVRFKGRLPLRPTSDALLAPLRALRLARRYHPGDWQADPLLAEIQAQSRDLEARGLRAMPWQRLIDTVHESLAIPPRIGEVRARYIPGMAWAVARVRLMLVLLCRADLFGTLLFTGVETKTLEMNRALEGLAAQVRIRPDLGSAFASHEGDELWSALEAQPAGRAFLAELGAFLDEYGCRESGGTLQISQPTWREAPVLVLGILRGLAAAPPPSDKEEPAWQAARDELLAHRLLRSPGVRATFLRLLAEARQLAQFREDTRFYVMLPVPVLRQTLLEFGRRLAAAGAIERAHDVFHLKLQELEGIDLTEPRQGQPAIDLHALVMQRKAVRARLEGIPLVDPRLIQPVAAEGDALVRGMPGSPGVAEGPVRVIRDASEFGRLRPGDVLVAPYTNPAWTPLFQRAAAAVVDSGGPASHAAIVAREYGIPAVMGTVRGTRALAEGDRVRVDGSQGTVVRASP